MLSGSRLDGKGPSILKGNKVVEEARRIFSKV